MDPTILLTIIEPCERITHNSAGFIAGLKDLVRSPGDVELDLSTVAAQASTLGQLSDRLRTWYNDHQYELSETEQRRLWEGVDGCDRLLQALETATKRGETNNTNVRVSEQQRSLDLWNRMQEVFSQPKLERYATALEQQANGLTAFLHVFETIPRLERPAALENKKTSTTIDEAISSASSTSDEVLSWLRAMDEFERLVSDQDSGFEDAASSASPRRPTGSALRGISWWRNPSLSLRNLAINNEQRRGQRATTGQTSRQAPTPVAPEGSYGPPPPYPGSVFEADSSSSFSRDIRRVNDIRDQLRRMSIASSSLTLDQKTTDPMVEKIHSDLVKLQEIMMEFRFNEKDDFHGLAASIPPELEKQIEALFDQIRNNLRLVGNPDEQLLQGTDIHSRNASGETALHIAARKRPMDVPKIRKFLDLGASVLVKDHHLNTPLLSLLSAKYEWTPPFHDVVTLLLAKGSDVNVKTTDGWTALNRVTEDPDPNIARMLVERGANVNEPTPDGLTPLHRSARRPSLCSVDLLLSHSANPNAVSASGDTPLSLACDLRCAHNRGQATIVDLLVSAGASLEPAPPGGKQPLDAVIAFLKYKEESLTQRQWCGLRSSLEWSRNEIEGTMYTIHVLLRHLTKVTLHYTTRTSVRTIYAFGPMRNLEDIPIEDLRRHYRARIGEIVTMSDRELYDDMKSVQEEMVKELESESSKSKFDSDQDTLKGLKSGSAKLEYDSDQDTLKEPEAGSAKFEYDSDQDTLQELESRSAEPEFDLGQSWTWGGFHSA